MSNVEGKKRLLILGSFAQLCDVIQDAVDDGYYVLTTDNVGDSPGRKIANESHDVSIADVNGLIELSKKTRVEAVMNYCVHSAQVPYQKVCNALGLPCYGSEEQFRVFTDKGLFKDACLAHGVDVVESFPPNLGFLQSLDSGEFPIVVKPSDGRASKGIVICNSVDEISDALKVARDHSANGSVIAEKFAKGPEIAVKYFVADGEISLTSMSDIHTYHHGSERVYIEAQTFPSKYYERFLVSTDERVRAMIGALGVNNGPLSFSGFVDGGRFRFIDPSFRMGGAQDWLIVEKITGVKLSKLMTEFAFSGSMGARKKMKVLDKTIGSKSSAILYFLARPGKIGAIRGIEEAAKDPVVIGHHLCHREGSEIVQLGTSDHVVLRFLLVAPDPSSLKSSMRRIQAVIQVLDDEGANMLYPGFDPESLSK